MGWRLAAGWAVEGGGVFVAVLCVCGGGGKCDMGAVLDMRKKEHVKRVDKYFNKSIGGRNDRLDSETRICYYEKKICV